MVMKKDDKTKRGMPEKMQGKQNENKKMLHKEKKGKK
jgi:hypothetical protein